MPFTEEPRRRTLADVVSDVGGVAEFVRLMNGGRERAAGPPNVQQPRPRPRSIPSRPIPPKWWHRPPEPED